MRLAFNRWIATARQGLVALVASFAAMLPFAAPAAAEPALWAVKDADTTIYLFGTVHLLRPETKWRSEKISAALETSSDLWLEIAEGSKFTVEQAQLWKFGKDPAHPLSTKLNPDELKRLREAAKLVGLRPVSLESLRPWLAAVVLGTVPMVKAGYTTELGVDNQLRSAAMAANKPINGLETIEQQFGFLAGMPPEMELSFLSQTIAMQTEGVDQLDRLVAAWLAGDVDRLAQLMRGEGEIIGDEDFYKHLLVDRNQQWVTQIEAMMKHPGTHFIAVGAAHLAGSDSVQALLQKRGLTVIRQ